MTVFNQSVKIYLITIVQFAVTIMTLLLNTFVILHIKLYGKRFLGLVDYRVFVNLVLLIIILIAFIQEIIAGSKIEILGYSSFIEASIFLIGIVYVTMMWMLSWPKANKVLNQSLGHKVQKHKK